MGPISGKQLVPCHRIVDLSARPALPSKTSAGLKLDLDRPVFVFSLPRHFGSQPKSHSFPEGEDLSEKEILDWGNVCQLNWVQTIGAWSESSGPSRITAPLVPAFPS